MIEVNNTKSYNKITVYFIFLFFAITALNAQDKTIYYNANWTPVVKDSASFYRPAVKKEGEFYRIKDYYISGKLQMTGLSKSDKKDIWHGKVTWYNEDGSLFQQGNYKENKLEGEFITMLGDEKLVSMYENGYFISGKRNTPVTNAQFYMEKNGDSLKEIYHDSNIKGIRYEYYSDKKASRPVAKFYNKGGVYIGQSKRNREGRTIGLEVSYYFNPMRVRNIQYYKDGLAFGRTVYYENGQIREQFNSEPIYSKEYYRKDGSKLGKIDYSVSGNYLKPENGAEYTFASAGKKKLNSQIQSIRIFKDGKIASSAMFYDNGKIRQKETYENGSKILQISYDVNGKEIATMNYDKYSPSNGTEIYENKRSTYKDGKLVVQEVFYPNTEIIFSIKKDGKETFYDKTGLVLGVLVYENNESYKKVSGVEYTLDYMGRTSRIKEYKSSSLLRETSFVYINDSVKTFKTVAEYAPASFTIVKEVKYYSNGKKQSETTFKKYDKQNGIYYNTDGEIIGNYNFVTNEGTYYDFFSNSDDLRELKEVKNGKTIRIKKYDYFYNRDTRKNIHVLLEDVDVKCCGKYYAQNGELLAELTFKNEMPWEGTMIDSKTRELFTIKAGKRNGLYQKLNYRSKVEGTGQYSNDLQEGVFKYFDYKGKLKYKENYKLGKLDGKSIYYNADGSITSELIYKNGTPFEGKKTTGSPSTNYGTEEIYKNGKKIVLIEYRSKGKHKTLYTEDDIQQHVEFAENNKDVRYTYNTKNWGLTGDVIKFDEKGTEINKAVFTNGILVSGQVFLKDNGENFGVEYISLEKNEERVKVYFYDENDRIIFRAEEVVKPNSNVNFMKKLNLRLDFVEARNLY